MQPGGDCPGDPTPGTYGDLDLRSKAKLAMTSGTYTFCSVRIGRSTLVLGSGTTIAVAAGGPIHVSNETTFGQQCGDIAVLADGPSTIRFGHAANITARVCAPQGKIALGHGNHLLGQFVGNFVTSDRANDGKCCGGRCACVDDFDPTSVPVGATITFSSRCDLVGATAVKVCGFDAPITSKGSGTMTVTVPAGASGACPVEVDSAAGNFVAALPLLVP